MPLLVAAHPPGAPRRAARVPRLWPPRAARGAAARGGALRRMPPPIGPIAPDPIGAVLGGTGACRAGRGARRGDRLPLAITEVGVMRPVPGTCAPS